MFKGNSILAVVPARGGSKGIKKKNIYPFLGKPLLAHTADIIKQIEYFDRSIVSTDSQEIAKVAQHCGLEVPFMRPPELSGDRVSDWEVMNHSLKFMEVAAQKEFDVVILLPPTSPLRQPEWIKGALEMLLADDWGAVWTVSKSDSKLHPLKQLVVEEGSIQYFDPAGASIIARQQLGDVFHRNGVAYVVRRRCILKEGTLKPEKTGAYVIEGDVVNIDSLDDIRFGEFLMRENREQSFS